MCSLHYLGRVLDKQAFLLLQYLNRARLLHADHEFADVLNFLTSNFNSTLLRIVRLVNSKSEEESLKRGEDPELTDLRIT